MFQRRQCGRQAARDTQRSDRKRVVIELRGPRYFDESPIVGPHQEPEGIGFSTRSGFAAPPRIAGITAPREFIERKLGAPICRTASCEYFAER